MDILPFCACICTDHHQGPGPNLGKGQTLESAIVWLDSRIVPAGGAYVALSRIRKMDNLRFLVSSERIQYNPVSVLPS